MSVLTVDFSSDGKYIVTGSGDGTVKMWDIEKDCVECGIHQYSLAELQENRLKLEPSDLLILWEQGIQLSDEELHLIGKDKNKTK